MKFATYCGCSEAKSFHLIQRDDICCVFFCGSRSLHGSAGERVLVNTHSQRRRICKTSSLTARQLAHTSKCSPFDRSAPSRSRWWRGGDVARCCDACIFWAKICNEVMIWPGGIRQNMTADYIFNLQCVQVEVFFS